MKFRGTESKKIELMRDILYHKSNAVIEGGREGFTRPYMNNNRN